ncbi:hypothetical protein ElyMa_001253000 [Elysia marginata]|uniref:Uncharacterized protein n=1 Tax=Elysia marginata TaxID=1093978 RepID=A0AAV4ICZ5_9GAST|nr:hypothetical protein ElyMa_001253000 [Elysia marginata]
MMKSHQSLQKSIMEGKINGKRQRGRKRKSWLGNIEETTTRRINECCEVALNREEWRRTIASNLWQETEQRMIHRQDNIFQSSLKRLTVCAATLLVYLFLKAAAEEHFVEFCAGSRMLLVFDYTLITDKAQRTGVKGVRIFKPFTDQVICKGNIMEKQGGRDWMVDCGYNGGKADNFSLTVTILSAEHKKHAGKYVLLTSLPSTDSGGRITVNVNITDDCFFYDLKQAIFGDGIDMESEYELPAPRNPWPTPLELMITIVVPTGILMLSSVGVALFIWCLPKRCLKCVMGQYAKSSAGGSSSSDSDESRSVNVEVYGGGSKVLAVVDDSYMQDIYQSPTGSVSFIPHTLRINQGP